MPPKNHNVNCFTSFAGSDQAISQSFSPKHVLPNIKKASGDKHKAVANLLKSCMDEKEFKINIIKGKKKVSVKQVFHSLVLQTFSCTWCTELQEKLCAR